MLPSVTLKVTHTQKAQQLNEWVKAVTFLTAYLNNLMSHIVFRSRSITKTHLLIWRAREKTEKD